MYRALNPLAMVANCRGPLQNAAIYSNDETGGFASQLQGTTWQLIISVILFIGIITTGIANKGKDNRTRA